MSLVISRRKLLSGGLKTGIGAIVLRDVAVNRALALVAEQTLGSRSDRFQAAFQLLDDYISRHMAEVGAPGMTLGLADRTGLLRSSQYGFADVKAGIKVSPQTLFEIGSISKSFVAIAVLQLVEEGKVELNKPVTNYLPWLKIESKYGPITTHHLLSHTSGLSAIPLLMRVAATTLRAGFEPGSRWVYSNIGYVLLGFLIEAIDKRPFAEALRQRVLVPLGMNSSAPVISNEIRERLAVGYAPLLPDRPFAIRGKLGEAPWLEVPDAAGSVAATASDMGNYLQMLLNRGAGPKSRVLSEKSFELFTKPVIKSAFRGEDASYAYGLWVSDTNAHTLLRHTGGMVAFSSAMFADVTAGFAAFASVNAARLPGGYRPIAVVRYALALLNAASQGQDLPAAPPPPPSPTSIKNAADYAGVFTLASSGEDRKLVLTSEGDQLILQHGASRIALEQAGPDTFLVKHPDFELFMLGFGREKNVVVEAFHGSNWWVNEKYSGAKKFDYPKEWEAYTGHFHSDSPWYGSTRIVIRKGQLLLGGDQPLAPIEAHVFRPSDDPSDADRLTFDMFANGRAMRMTFSGVEFFRMFTP
ncbi:MAG TPA: serine hydrolase domain-containing protein [Pyrinomonadaceae bacterium]|nr:serine hydrolase domain-containing protein [Pyrinomonadaceae bacterium]